MKLSKMRLSPAVIAKLSPMGPAFCPRAPPRAGSARPPPPADCQAPLLTLPTARAPAAETTPRPWRRHAPPPHPRLLRVAAVRPSVSSRYLPT